MKLEGSPVLKRESAQICNLGHRSSRSVPLLLNSFWTFEHSFASIEGVFQPNQAISPIPHPWLNWQTAHSSECHYCFDYFLTELSRSGGRLSALNFIWSWQNTQGSRDYNLWYQGTEKTHSNLYSATVFKWTEVEPSTYSKRYTRHGTSVLFVWKELVSHKSHSLRSLWYCRTLFWQMAWMSARFLQDTMKVKVNKGKKYLNWRIVCCRLEDNQIESSSLQHNKNLEQ